MPTIILPIIIANTDPDTAFEKFISFIWKHGMRILGYVYQYTSAYNI